MGTAQDRGRAAERLAAAYLECLGCRILERNVRLDGVEVDLVVADGPVTAVVEVRLRSRSDYGTAAATVDPRKQERLRRAALALVARGVVHPRVDVVAIDLGPRGARIAWLCNAVSG
jgi:putative endonuclease